MMDDKALFLFMAVLVMIGVLLGFALFVALPWLWRVYGA